MCSRAPSLEVINEVDEIESERDVISDSDSPQLEIPASSSPCLCSLSSCSYCNCNTDSASASASVSASLASSRSSRSSLSERSHSQSQESVSNRNFPSGIQDHQRDLAFVEDLCGRLLNVSREAEVTSRRVDAGVIDSSLRASPLSFEKTPLSGLDASNIPENILQSFGLPVKRAQTELSTIPLPTATSTTKRSFSLADLNCRPRQSDALFYSSYETLLPPFKKRRPTRSSSIIDEKEGFASQTATSRRARSLRNEADYSDEDGVHAIPLASPDAESTIPSSDKENTPGWIPTAPCSPEPHSEPEQCNGTNTFRQPLSLMPISPLHFLSDVSSKVSRAPVLKKKKNRKSSAVKAIPFEVPIIAPPPGHAWRPPLSQEAQAKTRLLRFKERDENMRKADRAWQVDGGDEGSDTETKVVEFEFVYESVGQMSTYEPDSGDEEDGTHEDVEMRDVESDELDEGVRFDGSSSQGASWADISRFEDGMSKEVIEWILEVLPPIEEMYSPQSSNLSLSSKTSADVRYSVSPYSSTSSSSYSSPFKSPNNFDHGHHNLMDQLLNSPETRFHAAYLFRRFFCIVLGSTDDNFHRMQSNSAKDGIPLAKLTQKFSWDMDGCEMITWDVAVGCLALSVKMHRDFLPPLFPVHALLYEDLAPHDMSYGNLEAAQRDILFALSYNLGSSPQAILDDLWLALPSLRELLDVSDRGRSGWNLVLQGTWEILYTTVGEPKIMEFPLSLVTVAALMEALKASLVRKHESSEPWYYEFWRRRVESSIKTSYARCHIDAKKVLEMNQQGHVRKANIESEGVMLDIQAALGIPDGPLTTCREWISSVGAKK